MDFLELTKPRINLMAALVATAGFYLATTGPIDPALLFNTLVAILLLGAGAGVLNQYIERSVDSKMNRTKNRPIPSGRVSPLEARLFGAVLAATGLLVMTLLVNHRAALVGAVTLVLYLWAYTPMKTRSSLSTLIGAAPGALPPVIGWTAAGGDFSPEVWCLFSILFLWQLPHFMAISWIYREDYARGGMPLHAVLDPDGRRCASLAMLHTLVLVPVSLTPVLLGLSGLAYCCLAAVLGMFFLGACASFLEHRGESQARRLFLYSLAYLPLLFLFLAIDRGGVGWAG